MNFYYLSNSHRPSFSLADDGFGNLLWVKTEIYIFNFTRYVAHTLMENT